MKKYLLIIILLTQIVTINLIGQATSIYTYIYDDLNRLTEVQYGNGTTIQYEYDQVGHRTLRLINGTNVQQPDLTPTNGSLSLNTVGAGAEVTVVYNNENIGTASSGGFYSIIVLSDNTTYEEGVDEILTTLYTSNLTAGAMPQVSELITIPVSTSAGVKNILIFSDSNDDVINELSETNNVFVIPITVEDCSGLSVSVNTVDETCQASNGSATATGSGGASPYSFDWGTIPAQTGNTATALFAGNYAVSVTDNNGCEAETTFSIDNAGDNPVANFSYSFSGLDVTFTNTSAFGASYIWDFGDGNTSTLENPTHLYASSGDYTVCLSSTNTCGTDQYCVIITANDISCNVPEGLSVIGITETSADLGWNNVSGAIAYNILYRVTGEGTWNSVINTTNASYTIIDLIPGTSYEFQVETDCGGSTSGYSGSWFFSTSPSGEAVSGSFFKRINWSTYANYTRPIVETSDGNLIMGSYYVDNGKQKTQFYKFDLDGNLIWSKSALDNYPEGGKLITHAIAPSNTGGALFTMDTDNLGVSGKEFYKLSSSGQLEFVKSIQLLGAPEDHSLSINSIRLESDGGYIIAGSYRGESITIGSTGTHENFPLIIKTDSNLNVLWTKRLQKTNSLVGILKIYPTNDGGYLAVCNASLSDDEWVHIIKFDSSWNISWSKQGTFNGDYLYAYRYFESPTHYYVMGQEKQFSTDQNSALYIKVEKTSGDLVWAKDFRLTNGENTSATRMFELDDELLFLLNNKAVRADGNATIQWIKETSLPSWGWGLATEGSYFSYAYPITNPDGGGSDMGFLKMDNNFENCTISDDPGSVTIVDRTTAFSYNNYSWSSIQTVNLQVSNYNIGNSEDVTLDCIIECESSDCSIVSAINVNSTTICQNETINLFSTSTGASTYSWKIGIDGIPFSTDANTGYTFDNPGIYTVYLDVTDGGSCIDQTTVMITVNSVPEIYVNAIDEQCAGGNGMATVDVSAVANPQIVWNTGATAATINNLSAGNYSVQVTDDNGCSTTQNIVIDNTSNGFTVSGQVSEISCYGANDGSISVSTNGTIGNVSYFWSNGSNSNPITELAPDQYSVTVSDDAGCEVVAGYTVNEPEEIALDFQINHESSIGAGDGFASVLPTGGTLPYSYIWSNGATTSSTASLMEGSYTVSVMDANGCATSIGINVFVQIESAPGVQLYKKDYFSDDPDYVQIIDLEAGASIEFYTGAITSGEGTANPFFEREDIEDVWIEKEGQFPNTFSVTNGQFFNAGQTPGAQLAFPLKESGTLVAEGYGNTSEFVGEKLFLPVWSGMADVIAFNDDPASINSSDAIGGIVGLHRLANKGLSTNAGRTFAGVIDENNDGIYEKIAIFTSLSATQYHAADRLHDFGIAYDKIVMLDGGGSTQMICNGTSYVNASRLIPQSLVVYAAAAPQCVSLTSPLNGSTDVDPNIDLSWSADPAATGYRLTVGTTSGGTEIVNNEDVQNSTTYVLNALDFNTTYFVTITPYNSTGSATACSEESFTTTYDNSLSINYWNGNQISIHYPGPVDPLTVSSSTVVVNGEETGFKMGSFSVSGNDVVLTFNEELKAGELIFISSTAGVLDINGNAMPSYGWIKHAPVTNSTNAEFSIINSGIVLPTDALDYALDLSQADFDKNGKIDVVVRYITAYGYPTNILIYLQNLDGTFTGPTTYTNTSSHSGIRAIADLNNDEYPDLILTHNVPSTVHIRLNNGDGTFGNEVLYTISNYSNGVEIADIDNDGDIDIIGKSGYSILPGNTISILKNNGDGTFQAQITISTGTFGGSALFGDPDNDGDMDYLYTSGTAYSSSPTFRVYENDSQGNYTLFSSESNPSVYYLAFGEDYNGDGNFDFITIGANGSQLNLGDGTLNLSLGGSTNITTDYIAAVQGDLNGDGAMDLFNFRTYNGTDWTTLPFKTYLNVGLGNFNEVVGETPLGVRQSRKTTDIDDDGDLDFLFVGVDRNIYIALNGPVETIPECTSISSPTNGATDVSINTSLTWNAIENATGYLISVGTTSGGTEILNNVDVLGATSYSLPTLDYSTAYFVTILPYNNSGTAEACVEESFVTEENSANCLVVVNTNDSGAGSLREAIICANANPDLDDISFNIPGAGPFVIQLLSALPYLQDAGIQIDGTTQPDYYLGIIEIDGVNLSNSQILYLDGGGHMIKGLHLTNSIGGVSNTIIISSFNNWIVQNQITNVSTAINLAQNDNNLIEDNFIGTDSNHSSGLGIGVTGIFCGLSSDHNIIRNNTIAYCGRYAVLVNQNSHQNLISQNSLFCNGSGSFPDPIYLDNGNQDKLFPIILGASPIEINGTSEPNDIIELFTYDDTGCVGVPCQGKNYLGNVTANASGNWTFTGSFGIGDKIVATATDANNNTSQFSGCLEIGECNTWYADTDGDTFGNPNVSQTSCTPLEGYVLDNTDCDDTNANVNPNVIWYIDTDGDSYGNPNITQTSCTPLQGFVLDNTDCDDTNDNINPTTIWYADTDGDTYGDPNVSQVSCEQPAGYVLDNTDCDDSDPDVFPNPQIDHGNCETCVDGIQNGDETAVDCGGVLCVPCLPECTNLTSPLDGATDVSNDLDISWATVPDATGYIVIIGITSGGTDIADNVDVGNVTTYNPGTLPSGNNIFVTIIPYNVAGNAQGCVEESFATEMVCPDFYIDSLSYFNGVIYGRIKNIGSTTASLANVSIKFSYSPDGNPTTSYATQLTFGENGPDLVPGEVFIYNNNVDLNFNNYPYLVGEVDVTNVLAECDETNNITVFNLIFGCTDSEAHNYNPDANSDDGSCTTCDDGIQNGDETDIDCGGALCAPCQIPCTQLIEPLNGAIDVSIETDITWASVTGANGYFLTVGTTSGGTDIVNNSDVGNVTTYDLGTLDYLTTYYVTIIPYDGAGNASGCLEESFTTEEDNTGCNVPVDWVVNPADYDFSGQITAQVFVDDVVITAGTLAAFVGNECRGVATAAYFPPGDHYIFSLLCYSNVASGEYLTFKYLDPVTCEVCDLSETIEFTPDMILGNAITPEVLNCTSAVEISIDLNGGWTWFSVNVLGDDMSLGAVLASIPLSDGDYIKSQTLTATYYDGYGWFGNLLEIDPKEMYMIKLANPATLVFSGIPVDVTTTSILLNMGWTWIGYIPQQAMDINLALGGLALVDNDYIKSQVNTATYYTGFGWFGNLDLMAPFAGYKIKMSNADELLYPEENAPPRRPEALPFAFNFDECELYVPDYEFTGSISAQVFSGDQMIVSENDELFAFIGEECRGMVKSKYFPETGAYEFPIMVYHNVSSGDSLSFKYFDSRVETIFDCIEKMEFTSDMIKADAYAPEELHLESTLGFGYDLSKFEDQLMVYPNPFSNTAMVTYSVSEPSMVSIRVFDVFGNLVETLKDQWHFADDYNFKWQANNKTSGTYLIVMTTGSGTSIRKVTLFY